MNAVVARGFVESVEAVVAAARTVSEGGGAFDRDGVVFSHEEVNWPVLCCVLHAIGASERPRKVVLDFGGGLGSFYRQHRRFFEGIDLRWCVVETPELVAAGKEFSDEALRFFPSIAAAAEEFGKIDVALLSGVICYLPSIDGLFDEIEPRIPSIVLSRSWEDDGMEDTYYVQRVTQGDEEFEVVFRLWGRDNLLRALRERGFCLTVSEDEGEPIGINGRIYHSRLSYWRRPSRPEEGGADGGGIALA